jgi:ATP-dependent Clp protease protease subunit
VEEFQTDNLDRGHVYLIGEVDDEKIGMLIEQLVYLGRRRRVTEVTLWVNSSGGLLQPAFALVDLMAALGKPVRTVGLGTIESAAALILIGGTRGRRLMTRCASMMLHEYSWSNSGSVTEMRGRMTEIQNTLKKQVEHLVRCSGRGEDEVRALLKHEETWLTPVQAVEWGLIDRVVDFDPTMGAGVPAPPPRRPRRRPARGRKRR